MILPTLKQLRYLVAVSDHRHFGHAADACFVTQSTLSTGLKELENMLGVVLVERTKRSVVMTPIGKDIALRATDILTGAEDLVDLAKSDGEPLSGKLRLGVIPTIGPYLLPSSLPVLQEKYPALQLFLKEDQTARLLNLLSAGELDIVLMALPYEMQGIEIIMIGDDEFEAVSHADGPFSREGEVGLEELTGQNLLLLEEGHCLRDHALKVCKLKQGEGGGNYEATSLFTLVQMVNAGLGVTLLPKMAIQAGLVRGTNLVTRPLKGTGNSRQIGVVYRKTSSRAEEFQILANIFRESLRQPDS